MTESRLYKNTDNIELLKKIRIAEEGNKETLRLIAANAGDLEKMAELRKDYNATKAYLKILKESYELWLKENPMIVQQNVTAEPKEPPIFTPFVKFAAVFGFIMAWFEWGLETPIYLLAVAGGAVVAFGIVYVLLFILGILGELLKDKE
ncbi:MAG: hypothetical protein LBC85_09040 [Fibromonadaceae bacterium]|nr:hypothetical protein [Fibromonadaceae bacterium]